MKELTIRASTQNLDAVKDFVLSGLSAPNSGIAPDIELAVEEIFINICHHAFVSKAKGDVLIRTSVKNNTITIEFEDGGIPHNPLQKKDPDTTLSLSDRKPGGLGVFLIKTYTDTATYRFKNGKNILTVTKSLQT
jgi:sigma-B regulation protein RsbU (phosphoserine phosphatase)